MKHFKGLDGLKESLQTVNGYVWHMDGSQNRHSRDKILERVRIKRLNAPINFADVAEKVERERRRAKSGNSFKKNNRMGIKED